MMALPNVSRKFLSGLPPAQTPDRFGQFSSPLAHSGPVTFFIDRVRAGASSFPLAAPAGTVMTSAPLNIAVL